MTTATNGHVTEYDEPTGDLTAITVERLTRAKIILPIEGITPLIVHRFDEKARQTMLADQQGKKKAGREKRDPKADYERSKYLLPDGADGFPSVAFKAAMINAVTHFTKLTKVWMKQSIFVSGEGPDQLIRIIGKPEMREDYVRLSQSSTDLRYRAMYWPWEAELDITYVASAVTMETVIALVDAAGIGGVGEWRPSAPKSNSGTFGQFRVKETDQ